MHYIVSFSFLQKLLQGNAQDVGDAERDQQRDAAFGTLDVADVVTVKSAPRGEFLLAQAKGYPPLLHVLTECHQTRVFLMFHTGILLLCKVTGIPDVSQHTKSGNTH